MPTLHRLHWPLLLLPPAAAYALLAVLHPSLGPELPRFLAFFLAFLVLPAHALGGLLLRQPLSAPERAALGYPAAQALLFLLLFAGGRLGLLWLPWALPALGLAVLLLPRLRRETAATEGADTLLWIVALVAALASCFVGFAATPYPAPGAPADFYHDDVGSAAYIWAAVRSLETGQAIAHPWVAGFRVSYHLVYHYTYAYAHLLTGAQPVALVLHLWPPAHWLMLSGCAVVSARRLAGLPAGAAALLALLLFFSAGHGFYSTPAVQLYRAFHSFFYGLPALILVLAALYGHLTSRLERLPLALLGLAFLVVGGTKVNLLLLLPLCLLPVLAYRLWTRQAKAADFLLGLIWAAAALTLKLTMFQDASRIVVKSLRLGKLFMGALGNLGEMALAIGPYVLLAALAAGADPLLRRMLWRDRQYHIFLLGFVLVSAVLLKAINFVGGDFYFYWQARTIAFVGFAGVAWHMLRWRTRLYAPLLVLLLALGAALHVKAHFFATAGAWQPADPQAKTIDHHEYDGLRWAAAHLDRRRSMVSNKDGYLGNYLGTNIHIDALDYLGLSGMQGWSWPGEWLSPQLQEAAAPRNALKERFLNARSASEREAALSQMDADYYFHCERQMKSDFAGVRGMREVYRNPSLTIYELTRGAAGQ